MQSCYSHSPGRALHVPSPQRTIGRMWKCSFGRAFSYYIIACTHQPFLPFARAAHIPISHRTRDDFILAVFCFLSLAVYGNASEWCCAAHFLRLRSLHGVHGNHLDQLLVQPIIPWKPSGLHGSWVGSRSVPARAPGPRAQEHGQRKHQ